MAHSYRPNSEDSIKIDRSTLVLTIDGMIWTMPTPGSTIGTTIIQSSPVTINFTGYTVVDNGGNAASSGMQTAFSNIATDLANIRAALALNGIVT